MRQSVTHQLAPLHHDADRALTIVLRLGDSAANVILLREVAVPPPPITVAEELGVQRGGREGRAPERHAPAHHAPAERVEERGAAESRAAPAQQPIEDVAALDGVPDALVLPDSREKLLRLLGDLHVRAELDARGGHLGHGGDVPSWFLRANLA